MEIEQTGDALVLGLLVTLRFNKKKKKKFVSTSKLLSFVNVTELYVIQNFCGFDAIRFSGGQQKRRAQKDNIWILQ